MLFRTKLSLLPFETSPGAIFEDTCQVKLLIGDKGGVDGGIGGDTVGGTTGWGAGGVTVGVVLGGVGGAGLVLF